MGWSSGSEIYRAVATELRNQFEHDNRARQECVLNVLIGALEDGDCDTLDECFGISLISDSALRSMGYESDY